MGGGGELEEPGRHSPDAPGLIGLNDSGAEAASPGVALPGTPVLVPRTTKSCNKLMALSPRWGPASATSMLTAPYGASPALGTSVADATTGH
jgi:hypothetical protein